MIKNLKTCFLVSVVIAGFVLSAMVSESLAQTIEVADGETHTHQESGTRFVPKVTEFERIRVNRFQSDNDVGATYEDRDGGTFATVYVTRVGTPDPYLWFDRVLGLITQREGFTPLIEQGVQPEFFTAPGFDRASGIRVTYATTGGDIRSSGLAIMAYGDMLVKIRVSSPEYDRVELEGVMDRFIAGFALPKPTGVEVAAYTIQDCSDALTFGKAKQQNANSADGLEQAIREIAATLQTIENEADFKTAQYCRDASSDRRFAIYRPDGTRHGYLLSYNDTGRAVLVGHGQQTFLASDDRDVAPYLGYGIAHQLPDESVFYASFDSLPSPKQAAEIPGKQPIVSSTDRKGDITLSDGLAATPED